MRKWGVSRKQLHTLRQRLQAQLSDTVPTEERAWHVCHDLIAENVPMDRTMLYPDEWQSYRDRHTAHTTVCHSTREWAREDDSEGIGEVHCPTCAGAGAALRTSRRAFWGGTSSSCTCMLLPLKPWSMPNGSRPT